MLLKEIGIKGFKSFANKIKLNITPGVTVIVGPNGCGKSNIIDAVRWLLGEQSMRSLRGIKNTDMIFAGNQENKIKNFAQVYMLFDNANRKVPIDSEEIEVKRVIHRSGEIENYINSIPCKLRDIQELFASLGLGKNSYSIIAQGRVDYVLNAKPAERRMLFEEASDVGIYRNKKDNALRKLELLNGNILRINDILHEVENTLTHYKKKSDNLEIYKKYKDYILKLEYYLLYHQYNSLHKNIEKDNKNIVYLKDKILKTGEILTKNKTNIIQIEQKKEQLEKQLNKYLENFQKNEIEKNNFYNQLAIIKQQRIDLNNLIQNNQENSVHLQKQYEKYSDNLSSIENDIKDASKDTESLKIDLKKEEALLIKYFDISSYFKENLFTIKTILKDINLYYSEFRDIRIKKESEVRSRNNSLLYSKKELDNISRKIINNNELYKNIGLELSVLEQNVKKLSSEEDEIKTELIKTDTLIQKKTDMIQNIHNDLKLKNKEIELLKELLSTSRNTSSSFDYLQFELEKSEDVLGFIDIKNTITKVPDNLKQIFNFILNEEIKILYLTHSDKILYLKQLREIKKNKNIKIIAKNLFSISDLDKNRLKNVIDIKNKKIIGFASHLLSFPSEYRILFEVMLGNILIVEDMKTALDIAEQTKGIFTIISLDGLLINEKGMISIGFEKKGMLEYGYESFKNRIIQLEQEVVYINNDLITNKDTLEREKGKRNVIYKNLKNISVLLKNDILKINDKKMQLTKIKNSINETHELAESLKNRKNEEIVRIDNLEKSFSILNKNIGVVENFLELASLYCNLQTKYVENINRSINEIKKSIENFKMKVSWNKEREDLLQKRKSEIVEFTANFHLEEKKRKEQLNQYTISLEQLTDRETEFGENLNLTSKRISELNEEIAAIKNLMKESENNLKNIRNNIDYEQEYLNNNKNKLHKHEMINTQNREKLNHLIDTLNTQYNVTIDEIFCYKKYSNNQTEALSLLSEYKDRIKQMGQINFDALQEYEEQFTKFKDLQSKKDEIVKSKEKLLSLITEIDRIAEEHFHKTFKEVEINFKEIFKKLFRGGEASLELTDNKKLLETGIEVLVQPPGKQVQNISLLSMGEKALTAIALLFALWKANPTPFCFFDEIDSSLDESNALRLSSFIKNDDLKDSQIIIITHQKRVMEAADALYGITMDGFGTSKLISVKMLNPEGE